MVVDDSNERLTGEAILAWTSANDLSFDEGQYSEEEARALRIATSSARATLVAETLMQALVERRSETSEAIDVLEAERTYIDALATRVNGHVPPEAKEAQFAYLPPVQIGLKGLTEESVWGNSVRARQQLRSFTEALHSYVPTERLNLATRIAKLLITGKGLQPQYFEHLPGESVTFLGTGHRVPGPYELVESRNYGPASHAFLLAMFRSIGLQQDSEPKSE